MRALVQPPPSSRCKLCGGELRFKLIEPANRVYGLDNELFVCVNCGHEQMYFVARDRICRTLSWSSQAARLSCEGYTSCFRRSFPDLFG